MVRPSNLVQTILVLLFTTDLKVLCSLNSVHVSLLADLASQTQHYLLGSLGLLVEDGLGLATIPRLLAIVTPLSLGIQRCLTGFILRYFVHSVLTALLAFAEGPLCFWDIHL